MHRARWWKLGHQFLSRCSCFLLKRALGPVSAWQLLRRPAHTMAVRRGGNPLCQSPQLAGATWPAKAVGTGATEFQGHLKFLFISSELIKGNCIRLESLTDFLFLSPSLLVSLIFLFVAFVNTHQNLPCCCPTPSAFPPLNGIVMPWGARPSPCPGWAWLSPNGSVGVWSPLRDHHLPLLPAGGHCGALHEEDLLQEAAALLHSSGDWHPLLQRPLPAHP